MYAGSSQALSDCLKVLYTPQNHLLPHIKLTLPCQCLFLVLFFCLKKTYNGVLMGQVGLVGQVVVTGFRNTAGILCLILLPCILVFFHLRFISEVLNLRITCLCHIMVTVIVHLQLIHCLESTKQHHG